LEQVEFSLNLFYLLLSAFNLSQPQIPKSSPTLHDIPVIPVLMSSGVKNTKNEIVYKLKNYWNRIYLAAIPFA